MESMESLILPGQFTQGCPSSKKYAYFIKQKNWQTLVDHGELEVEES